MKEMMVAMEMSQRVLISNHNAHTALLEQHRQTLTTIMSQPTTPSDRQMPEDGGAMERLSMPQILLPWPLTKPMKNWTTTITITGKHYFNVK
jgi:hypothetical protein